MTAKQMKTFWPAFNSACRELGLVDKSAREEYRHAVMWETASTKLRCIRHAATPIKVFKLFSVNNT